MADGDTPREIRVAGQHDDTSTACLAAWVEQARDIARQMYAVLPVRYMPVELFRQIQDDPGLFWLRGGEPPPEEQGTSGG